MSAQRQKDLANDRADYKTCALYGRTEREVSGSTKMMRLSSRFETWRQISRVAQDVGKENTENERDEPEYVWTGRRLEYKRSQEGSCCRMDAPPIPMPNTVY